MNINSLYFTESYTTIRTGNFVCNMEMMFLIAVKFLLQWRYRKQIYTGHYELQQDTVYRAVSLKVNIVNKI